MRRYPMKKARKQAKIRGKEKGAGLEDEKMKMSGIPKNSQRGKTHIRFGD